MKTAAARPVLCVGLTPAVQEVREFAALEMGGVNRSFTVTHSSAGKGTNVAHVLKTLGHDPVLTGFIGGATGAQYAGFVRALGIRTDFVTTAARTRVCVTLIERDTGRITELVEEASLPTPAEWRAFHRKFAARLKRTSLLTLTGALMPGAPAKLYAQLTHAAQKFAVPVLIDSQKAPLLAALAHRPLLAKLNVHELENTLATQLPRPNAIIAGARDLVARGAQHVLVTHGEHGAWLVAANRAIHFASPRVPVCNPIGSGDAVTAGIAFALLQSEPMTEAIRLGIACGAANVMTPTPGTVKVKDVTRLRRQVTSRPA